MDPVEGGVDDNYVYPVDGVNDFDLDGTVNWNKWMRDRYNAAVRQRQQFLAWQQRHPRLTEAMMALAGARGGGRGGKVQLVQTKRITGSEVRKLQKAGYNVHALKGKTNASKRDIFKDKKGNLYVQPKFGTGGREPLGINIEQL